MKQLEDFIYHIPSAVDTDLCSRIIKEYKSSKDWKEGLVNGQENFPDFKPRSCEVLAMSDSKVIGWNRNRKRIDEELFTVFNTHMGAFVSDYPLCDLQEDSGYELLRYTEGGYYNFHTDAGREGQYVRTMSLILNLSKSADYTGGELEFHEGPKYSLDQGDIVIFPSNFLFPHRICPVEAGTRYSIVTWFR